MYNSVNSNSRTCPFWCLGPETSHTAWYANNMHTMLCTQHASQNQCSAQSISLWSLWPSLERDGHHSLENNHHFCNSSGSCSPILGISGHHSIRSGQNHAKWSPIYADQNDQIDIELCVTTMAAEPRAFNKSIRLTISAGLWVKEWNLMCTNLDKMHLWGEKKIYNLELISIAFIPVVSTPLSSKIVPLFSTIFELALPTWYLSS